MLGDRLFVYPPNGLLFLAGLAMGAAGFVLALDSCSQGGRIEWVGFFVGACVIILGFSLGYVGTKIWAYIGTRSVISPWVRIPISEISGCRIEETSSALLYSRWRPVIELKNGNIVKVDSLVGPKRLTRAGRKGG